MLNAFCKEAAEAKERLTVSARFHKLMVCCEMKDFNESFTIIHKKRYDYKQVAPELMKILPPARLP